MRAVGAQPQARPGLRGGVRHASRAQRFVEASGSLSLNDTPLTLTDR